jgi:predicted amidohydrolase
VSDPRALRVACVQLSSSSVKADNIATAERLVAEAAERGAELVVLPEKWNALGPAAVFRAAAETLDEGETVRAMRAWAREHRIVLVGGSITEARPGREKLSNTCVAIDRDGELLGLYRKIHMFDVDVGGNVYRESESQEAGDEIALFDTDGWRVGLTICYDVRFPELYRILALRGAQLVTVPAAFTLHTGKDHWELLLRARAVENQCYVLAAAEWGLGDDGRATYGRSMIVDPWGVVLACAPDEDGVVVADVSAERLQGIRAALPSLRNRVPGAYRWPSPE